jgi:hypothetical protein
MHISGKDQHSSNNYSLKFIALQPDSQTLKVSVVHGSHTHSTKSEYHVTRVAFGITKGGHWKHYTSYSGKYISHGLDGLTIPLGNDDDDTMILSVLLDDICDALQLERIQMKDKMASFKHLMTSKTPCVVDFSTGKPNLIKNDDLIKKSQSYTSISNVSKENCDFQ